MLCCQPTMEKAVIPSEEIDLPNAMASVHAKTGTKFVVIIDEWDTIFREDSQDEEAQYQMSFDGLKDDVMALLIHLGYLAYDYDHREVYIPNEEIRSEFRNAVEGNKWKTVVDAIDASEKLLRKHPAGEGFADITFLTRKHTCNPAMIIELKFDKSVESAINQIKKNSMLAHLKNTVETFCWSELTMTRRRKNILAVLKRDSSSN